jgi:hypothetical protein
MVVEVVASAESEARHQPQRSNGGCPRIIIYYYHYQSLVGQTLLNFEGSSVDSFHLARY